MTDNREAHTPTPWKIGVPIGPDGEAECIIPILCDYVYGDEKIAAVIPKGWDQESEQFIMNEETFANAEYIVKCVNSHQGLVDALRCQQALDMPHKDGIKVFIECGYDAQKRLEMGALEFVQTLTKEALKAVGAL